MHAADVGEAYRLAALSPDARGAYNIAADPVLDPGELARVLRPASVAVPRAPLRLLADLTYRARLQPAPPGWLDMGLAVPTMDTRRAREELGWTPTQTSTEALLELLDGMAHPPPASTPPLNPTRAGASASARCARASDPASEAPALSHPIAPTLDDSALICA